MFNDIGSKCKATAYVVAVLGMIGSVILCIAVIGSGEILLGIVFGAAGLLVSWVSGFGMYALGETVEQLEYVSSCVGGGKSSDSKNKSIFSATESVESKMIMCNKCGKYQFADRDTCNKCGARLR